MLKNQRGTKISSPPPLPPRTWLTCHVGRGGDRVDPDAGHAYQRERLFCHCECLSCRCGCLCGPCSGLSGRCGRLSCLWKHLCKPPCFHSRRPLDPCEYRGDRYSDRADRKSTRL